VYTSKIFTCVSVHFEGYLVRIIFVTFQFQQNLNNIQISDSKLSLASDENRGTAPLRPVPLSFYVLGMRSRSLEIPNHDKSLVAKIPFNQGFQYKLFNASPRLNVFTTKYSQPALQRHSIYRQIRLTAKICLQQIYTVVILLDRTANSHLGTGSHCR
jgi:hypothetical protein